VTSPRTVRSSAASARARVLSLVGAAVAAALTSLCAFSACGTDVNLGGTGDASTLLLDPTLEDLGEICEPCTTSATCPTKAVCVQIAGDLTFCANACPNGTECDTDEVCQPLAPGNGAAPIAACAPKAGVCTPAKGPVSEGGPSDHCGTLESPTTVAGCKSCDKDDKDCQRNGCYGGWWCNTATNRCRKPPTTCP
jgi:hypothetical protein